MFDPAQHASRNAKFQLAAALDTGTALRIFV